jgi:hypothetical protein
MESTSVVLDAATSSFESMTINYLILLGMSRENHQKSEIAHDLQEALLSSGGFGGGRLAGEETAAGEG